MKKIILFGFLALGPFMVANSADVTVQYPALLKLKQQELGQLIFKFMPNKDDQNFSWNYRANDPNVI